MNPKEIGEEVAVGLFAGPDDFRRVRAAAQGGGLMAQLWRRLESAVDTALWQGRPYDLGDLAFAAAVGQRADWAGKAVEAALELANRPWTNWVHREAGCMSLEGVHNAHQLSLAVDWLWPVLNRDQREALLGALIAKSVENLAPMPEGIRDPGDGRGRLLFVRRLDETDPHCLHPRPEQVNNWDLWFAAGLFLAACLAERAWLSPDPAWPRLEWGHYYPMGYELDQARANRWKALAERRIAVAMATELGPDGDYAEGVGYAGYGGQSLLMGLIALERVAGHNLFTEGVLALSRWARHQYPADLAFGATNFNDSSLAARLPPWLCAHVAQRSRDPVLQSLALESLEASPNACDHMLLLSLAPGLPAKPAALAPAAHYRHTGTIVWRTAQDRAGVFWSLKSGAHGGAHQHRDRNSFFLAAYGEHLAVDSGDGRNANPPASPNFFETEGHNCLLVDGRGQIGDNNNPLAGRILEHTHDDQISSVWADASPCYEGVTACRRRAVFLRPDLLVLADQVEADCRVLTWLLHGYNPDGRAKWTCGEGRATLVRPLAALHVVFAQPVEQMSVSTGTLDGQAHGVLRLQCTIRGQAVTALLAPVRAGEAGPEVETHPDGRLAVRFRGRTHTIATSAGTVTINGRQYRV